MNFFNNSRTASLAKELEITRPELDRILEQSVNPAFKAAGHEAIIWNKDSVMNIINENLAKEKAKLNINTNTENLEWTYSKYLDWKKSKEPMFLKGDAMWEKFRKKELVKDIINEKTDLNNSNISNVNEFLRVNKEIIISEVKLPTKPLTENKPLGSAGDITINELINKGLDVIDTPLVQMIRDNVDISVVGGIISSAIMYKAVMKTFMKAAYGPNVNPNPLKGLTASGLTGPNTRPKEIAFFMLMGAPLIVAALMGISYATSIGSKVVINVVDNTGSVESTGSEGTSSGISNSSFFLFLNKLPTWIKVILRYIAFSLIFTFITSVIGYNSNILHEISSQFNVYLLYFLKLYSILNFCVVLYYLVRLYIIKMFVQNKEYLNPEDYINFIKIELMEMKEFALKLPPIELAKVYKRYYFFMILYISIVLLGLTAVVIISKY